MQTSVGEQTRCSTYLLLHNNLPKLMAENNKKNFAQISNLGRAQKEQLLCSIGSALVAWLG